MIRRQEVNSIDNQLSNFTLCESSTQNLYDETLSILEKFEKFALSIFDFVLSVNKGTGLSVNSVQSGHSKSESIKNLRTALCTRTKQR